MDLSQCLQMKVKALFESFFFIVVKIADPPNSKVDIRVIYTYTDPDFSPKPFDSALLQSSNDSRDIFCLIFLSICSNVAYLWRKCILLYVNQFFLNTEAIPRLFFFPENISKI